MPLEKDISQMNDEELAVVENNIVDALLGAAAYRIKADHRREVVIKRDGKALFKFAIEPINEDAWRKCRRLSTKNRNKSSEEVDNSLFLAFAIYEATVPEDRARIWDNKEIWEQFRVGRGADVVNIVLKPAEKAKIIEILEDLGGYNDDDLDDMIRPL